MEEAKEAKPKKVKVKKPNLVDDLLASYQPDHEEEIVFVRKPYTCVNAVFILNGQFYQDVGFSKVCWPDAWDEKLGKEIAVRHAAEHLAKVLARVQQIKATL